MVIKMILKCVMILTSATVFIYVLYSEISYKIVKHRRATEDKRNGNIID